MNWLQEWAIVVIPILLTGIGTMITWLLTDRAKIEVRIVRLEDSSLSITGILDRIEKDVREIREWVQHSTGSH
jgi:hypothetical protein